MSLDITIKYKRPERVDYNATHAVCGSNVALCNAGEVFEETEWEANITLTWLKWPVIYLSA